MCIHVVSKYRIYITCVQILYIVTHIVFIVQYRIYIVCTNIIYRMYKHCTSYVHKYCTSYVHKYCICIQILYIYKKRVGVSIPCKDYSGTLKVRTKTTVLLRPENFTRNYTNEKETQDFSKKIPNYDNSIRCYYKIQ